MSKVRKKPVRAEELFEQKAEYRKVLAAKSFEEKIQDLVRLQTMNYQIACSVGRKCDKPWEITFKASQ